MRATTRLLDQTKRTTTTATARLTATGRDKPRGPGAGEGGAAHGAGAGARDAGAGEAQRRARQERRRLLPRPLREAGAGAAGPGALRWPRGGRAKRAKSLLARAKSRRTGVEAVVEAVGAGAVAVRQLEAPEGGMRGRTRTWPSPQRPQRVVQPEMEQEMELERIMPGAMRLGLRRKPRHQRLRYWRIVRSMMIMTMNEKSSKGLLWLAGRGNANKCYKGGEGTSHVF
jgi:hypothetical protein